MTKNLKVIKMENEKFDSKKFYEHLIENIKEANKNITHEEFVEGAKNRAMGFTMTFRNEPNILLSGSKKVIFNILVMLYIVGPFIFVPIFSYSADNWWFLFGIAFSFLFTHFAIWKGAKHPGKWKANIIICFTLLCIVYWIIKGFHFYDYITFFFFCSLWGHLLFRMAEYKQNEYAMQMLVESPDLFYRAIENNMIKLFYKAKEDKLDIEINNYSKASPILESGDKKFYNGDYDGAYIEYTKAVEFYPCVSAFKNRGNVKIEIKDYNGAISDYSEAIDRWPTLPNNKELAEIFENRAEAKRLLGLIDEAQLDMIEANKLLVAIK